MLDKNFSIKYNFYFIHFCLNLIIFITHKFSWLLHLLLLTVVYVSNDTGKNPFAVRQQTRLDRSITIIRSFRSIFPNLFMGIAVHNAEYAPIAIFSLCSITPLQLNVNMNSKDMAPIKRKMKMERLAEGALAWE